MREFSEIVLLASRDMILLVGVISLVLALVGKYFPAAWRHGIWLLVAIRLFMPALPESDVSWQVLVDQKEEAVVDAADSIALESSPEEVLNSDFVENAEVVEVQNSVVSTPVEEVPLFSEVASIATKPNFIEEVQSLEVNKLQVGMERKSFSWFGAMFYVWLTGASLLLCAMVVLAVRFSRKLKNGFVICDQQSVLDEMVKSIAEKHGWSNAPEVMLTDAVDVPALYGVIRPKVLIPPSVLSNISKSELNLILLHELGHWKRKDLWVNFMLAILQVIYWFNPFVWLAFHRVKVESERATDVWVLKRCGVDHSISYGEMLFSLLKDKPSRGNLGSGIVSVIESPRDLKRRMKGIVSFKGKSSFLSVVCSLVVMLVIAAACLTQAPAGEKEVAEKVSELDKINVDGELKVFKARALSSDGKPVAGAKVYYRVVNETPVILAGATDASGLCEISMDLKPSARIQLYVSHAEEGKAAMNINFRNLDPIEDIILSNELDLNFRVLDNEKRPLPNMRIRVASAYYPVAQFMDAKFENSERFMGEVAELPIGFWNAITDEEGRCTITGLRPGRYYVDHDNIDYAQPAGKHHYKFSYNPEIDKSEIELELISAASVSGTLRFPNGNPVVGAIVKTLETHPYTQGGSSAATVTDEEGRYQLDRLRPAVYTLKVTLNDDLKKDWVVKFKNYALKEGEEKTDFDVKLIKGGLIKGRLTFSDTGKGVPTFQMGITSTDSKIALGFNSVTTDENGNYQYRVPSGEHKIYLAGLPPEGYARRTIEKQIDRTIEVKDGQIYEVDFQLPKAEMVNGVVLDDKGQPIIGAWVSGFFKVNSFRKFGAESDETGKFSLSMPPGTTSLIIEANLGEMSSEKGKEYEVDPLVKVVIKKEADINESDSDESERISGKVVDINDKPIEGVKVICSNDGRDRFEVKTNLEGKYVFEKRSLGRQSLFFSKDGYGTNRRYRSKANEHLKLESVVLPIADASLSGKLVDESGKPVIGARVIATGTQQPNGSSITGGLYFEGFDAITDNQGKFILDGVVKGWLDVHILKKTVKGQNQSRFRLQTGTDSILTLNRSNVKMGRLEEVNLVGKMAPQLIARHWLNTEKFYPAVSSKVRLIQFVGTDRPFIYYSNFVETMEKLRKEFPEEELEIILVHGMWPKLEVEEIIAEDYPKLTLPVAIESRENAMSDAFGVNSWLTVVIDNQGKVVLQNKGRLKELRETLKELLGK